MLCTVQLRAHLIFIKTPQDRDDDNKAHFTDGKTEAQGENAQDFQVTKGQNRDPNVDLFITKVNGLYCVNTFP